MKESAVETIMSSYARVDIRQVYSDSGRKIGYLLYSEDGKQIGHAFRTLRAARAVAKFLAAPLTGDAYDAAL